MNNQILKTINIATNVFQYQILEYLASSEAEMDFKDILQRLSQDMSQTMPASTLSNYLSRLQDAFLLERPFDRPGAPYKISEMGKDTYFTIKGIGEKLQTSLEDYFVNDFERLFGMPHLARKLKD